VLVTAEKLDKTSLRLEISETDKLLTAEMILALAATQSSTDIELFADEAIVLRVLPRAMAICAVCSILPELSALTKLLFGLFTNRPLTRLVNTNESDMTVTFCGIT
jgi:hypothetical protein